MRRTFGHRMIAIGRFGTMSLISVDTDGSTDVVRRHSRRCWHATCFQDILIVMLVVLVHVLARMQRKPWFSRANF